MLVGSGHETISTDGTSLPSSDDSCSNSKGGVIVPATAPSIEVSMRPLAVIVAVVPAVAGYICIISTFILQPDIVSNYTLAMCPGLHSGFPPLSYSIGVWDPQKSFWILALLVHIPPNVLLITIVPQQWLMGSGRINVYVGCTTEMLALVAVTICHVDSVAGFKVHAGLFGLWAGAAIFGMIVMTHLQRLTGLRHRNEWFERTFWIKLCVVCLFCFATFGVAVLYPLSQRICSLPVFITFCLCEYAVIGLYGVFWSLCLYEFGGEFKSVRIVADARPNSKRKEMLLPKSVFFDQPS